MNPEEQEDLEAVFGKDAADAIRRGSDRRAEGYARRKGSTLPDMRRGKKPTYSKYPAVPIDRDNQGRGQEALEVDRPDHARPKARDRFREPRVEPIANRKVRTKSGKSQSYQVALTAEEYAEREAKLHSANAAALEAARIELEEATKNAPLALPISESPPSRFRSVDADVRRYAAQTELRTRPRPEPIDLCDGCGRVKSHYDDRPDIEQLLDELEPDEADADSEPDDSPYFPDLDDRSQWELDHAAAIAEDAAESRREQERIEAALRKQEAELMPWIQWVEQNPTWTYGSSARRGSRTSVVVGIPHYEQTVTLAEGVRAEYAAIGITSPPDEPFEIDYSLVSGVANLCVHCGVDPIQTQKDGLCRNCKTYKRKNAGALPPQKLIDSRKRKREGS